MSRHFKVELSTGNIDIYDGAVPTYRKDRARNFLVEECGWFIGWNDIVGTEPHLHAKLHGDDFLELMEPIRDNERMQGMELDMMIANLSTAGSIHYSHSHPGNDLVSLYYANYEWQDHWEGETVFYAEDGAIEYVNKYVPGRILMFDAKMPHSIRAQSPAGPQFRFTVSYFWSRNEEMVENLGEESGGEGRGD